MAKTRNNDGQAAQNWLRVDFGKAVRLIRLRSTVNAKSVALGQSPRELVLCIANDGTNYYVAASTGFTRAEYSDLTFPNTITTQYIELVSRNNCGDGNYIEINELEFFQQ